jgi:hypothetical protein
MLDAGDGPEDADLLHLSDSRILSRANANAAVRVAINAQVRAAEWVRMRESGRPRLGRAESLTSGAQGHSCDLHSKDAGARRASGTTRGDIVFAFVSRALSRAARSLAVVGLIVGPVAVFESPALASPAAGAARVPGRAPHISVANANAGSPNGISDTIAVVFIARARTARLTRIDGFTLQPGAPCGSVPTKRFATTGRLPLPLHNVGGTRWQFESSAPGYFRPLSVEALRVKLYVRACNRWGCSDRIITLDRTPNQLVGESPPGSPAARCSKNRRSVLLTTSNPPGSPRLLAASRP